MASDPFLPIYCKLILFIAKYVKLREIGEERRTIHIRRVESVRGKMRLQGLNESSENKRQTDWAETERYDQGRDGQRDTDMAETYRYILYSVGPRQAERHSHVRKREKDTDSAKTDRETLTV
jgi:hypothetical protein